MKLSKQDRKHHEQALSILDQSSLSNEDIEFCYRNLRPEATTDIGKGSAFFTPWEIACDFQIETLDSGNGRGKRVLDLCAGYGILSYMVLNRGWCDPSIKLTCVEINPEYLEIGKKLVPEAEWILADVFDVPDLLAGRKFDEFISNPPFGSVPKHHKQNWKNTPRFEYAVAEIGMQFAPVGTMIMPSGMTYWKISGQRNFSQQANPTYDKWSNRTGIHLSPNCGIDCSHTPFSSANVTVDIVNIEQKEELEYAV